MKAIDLGLSVRWGDSDIGRYSWDHFPGNIQDGGRSNTFTFGHRWMDPSKDIATSLLGLPWRMPSRDEAEELLECCKWQWISAPEHAGREGCIVTSRLNGNSIFLPSPSLYWTSEVRFYQDGWFFDDPEDTEAFCLDVRQGGGSICHLSRTSMLAVRPVLADIPPNTITGGATDPDIKSRPRREASVAVFFHWDDYIQGVRLRQEIESRIGMEVVEKIGIRGSSFDTYGEKAVIDRSDIVIFMLSDEAVHSEWMSSTVKYALSKKERKDLVFVNKDYCSPRRLEGIDPATVLDLNSKAKMHSLFESLARSLR